MSKNIIIEAGPGTFITLVFIVSVAVYSVLGHKDHTRFEIAKLQYKECYEVTEEVSLGTE